MGQPRQPQDSLLQYARVSRAPAGVSRLKPQLTRATENIFLFTIQDTATSPNGVVGRLVTSVLDAIAAFDDPRSCQPPPVEDPHHCARFESWTPHRFKQTGHNARLLVMLEEFDYAERDQRR